MKLEFPSPGQIWKDVLGGTINSIVEYGKWDDMGCLWSFVGTQKHGHYGSFYTHLLDRKFIKIKDK